MGAYLKLGDVIERFEQSHSSLAYVLADKNADKRSYYYTIAAVCWKSYKQALVDFGFLDKKIAEGDVFER